MPAFPANSKNASSWDKTGRPSSDRPSIKYSHLRSFEPLIELAARARVKAFYCWFRQTVAVKGFVLTVIVSAFGEGSSPVKFGLTVVLLTWTPSEQILPTLAPELGIGPGVPQITPSNWQV